MIHYEFLLILLSIVGAIVYVERQFSRYVSFRLEQMAQSSPILDPNQRFQCYYCGHLFPVNKRERIGQYDYCLEHGSKRKSSCLALYTKEASSNGRNVGIHPTNSGSEFSDNEQLPWVG